MTEQLEWEALFYSWGEAFLLGYLQTSCFLQRYFILYCLLENFSMDNPARRSDFVLIRFETIRGEASRSGLLHPSFQGLR